MTSEVRLSDFLVIGSGIAGLAFAIKASSHGSVNIITKKREFDSNTNYAQGGIASVISNDDSFESHIQDTLTAGAGLCDRTAVEQLVTKGPERLRELIEWGTRFSEKNGALDLGREGGHSVNRIAHARDLTGREIERALLDKVNSIPAITIFEDHTAVDLLTEHQLGEKTTEFHHQGKQIRCYGAYILDNTTGSVHTFQAKKTLLATGGAGQVYLHTSNPSIATGDGIAMAYRAGALIADMEFIQFHPTTLYQQNNKGSAFLISEAVRGEGAVLRNSRDEAFMSGVHELKDLAPRDIVARAIDRELKRLGENHVFLDITHKSQEALEKRFPNIYNRCMEAGIDMALTPIPVVPAAHYMCGGIVSDLSGQTTIANLYVSGESARTGVHGANRLASNSLLEALVFSHEAYMDAVESISQEKEIHETFPKYPLWNRDGTFDMEEWVLINHNVDDVKRIMWDYVGIVRSDRRLEKAYKRILLLAEEIHDYYRKSTLSHQILELRNLATIAKLIIKGAMSRPDSVGLHYNNDHPDKGKKGTVILRSEEEPSFVEDPMRESFFFFSGSKQR